MDDFGWFSQTVLFLVVNMTSYHMLSKKTLKERTRDIKWKIPTEDIELAITKEEQLES